MNEDPLTPGRRIVVLGVRNLLWADALLQAEPPTATPTITRRELLRGS